MSDEGESGRTFLDEIPDDVLRAVGRVALAAGRLEWVARQFLVVLHGTPKGQLRSVGDELKLRLNRLGQGFGVSVAPFVSWVDEAMQAVDERSRLAHTNPIFGIEDDGWAPEGLQIRENVRYALQVPELLELAQRLADLANQGTVHFLNFQGLFASPRAGTTEGRETHEGPH